MVFGTAEKVVVNFTPAELKTYLSTRRIVVADSGASSGRSIRKFLMQFGAKSDSILVCENYDEAMKALSEPTHILIADLKMGVRSGLELVEVQEKSFPNRLEVSSIVMSGDPSNVAIGMIAETDTDAVLIKPFNFQNFQDALNQALQNKIKPSKYVSLMEAGKEHLKKSELEKAQQVFQATKTLDPKPTLAFYYAGKIHEIKKQYDLAIKSFEEGLGFNPKDYRCLTGLFDVCMLFAQYPKAYEVAKRVHKDYPVSTQRILNLVRLSVYVKRFEDIVDYYQIFKNLESNDSILSRTVVAGMLVCSKYFSIKNEKEKCLEVLKQASVTAVGTGELRLEVGRYYMELGFPQEGMAYLATLPQEIQDQAEAKLLEMELMTRAEDWNGVVKTGTLLVQQNEANPRAFQLLIEASKKSGRNASAIEKLVEDAKSKHPASASLFVA